MGDLEVLAKIKSVFETLQDIQIHGNYFQGIPRNCYMFNLI